MQGLTKKQQEIVEFIENFTKEKVYSPSYREIQLSLGFASLGSVYDYIQILKRKNVLEVGKGARSLFLSKKAVPFHVEIPLIGKLKGGMPIETFSKIINFSFPPALLPAQDKLYYLLQIEGHELIEEFIQENDLLLIEPRNHFEDGELVIAAIHLTTFIKKAFYDPPYFRLESASPEVAPLMLREDHVNIQGIVVSLFRNYTG